RQRFGRDRLCLRRYRLGSSVFIPAKRGGPRSNCAQQLASVECLLVSSFQVFVTWPVGGSEPRCSRALSPLQCAADSPDECRQSTCAVTRRRFSSGCNAHPATAPAGSNRGRHGGDEMSEAPG